MIKISTIITRGKNIESIHNVKCLIINQKKEIILTTKNDNDLIFPRSSIKIFQAIPFIKSKASSKFKLSPKQIALSCSSHCGELFHIKELEKWIKKINIPIDNLLCGIHNPINKKYSEKLLLKGKKPNQLHNNCSGKHLAMISSCLSNNFSINNYLDFFHPHQINIRKTLELFSENKILKNNFGIDGCSAPQYALSYTSLSIALLNLINSYYSKFDNADEVKLLISNILKFPEMIGGTNRFDSYLIKVSDKRIFCKGGAEGVILFAHLTKKIVGIIKIEDGNERAIPSALSKIFKHLKITDAKENEKLSNWCVSSIFNHAKKETGRIYTVIN